eukprot:CAMPEP_0183333136 /NCGR_PEP_ID=MMETSP0164_2-20130417/2103_1 /TAXON_ID=221442 /ORGANISM="Coccolithus pelagicus ssp braarudi, Strain PLY182g" /LENGTH=472 /DNA_ID=CAMNT_0025501981 /DNA_START=54 /DNA_END=1472 /DNA_ORIENTATION=-
MPTSKKAKRLATTKLVKRKQAEPRHGDSTKVVTPPPEESEVSSVRASASKASNEASKAEAASSKTKGTRKMKLDKPKHTAKVKGAAHTAGAGSVKQRDADPKLAKRKRIDTASSGADPGVKSKKPRPSTEVATDINTVELCSGQKSAGQKSGGARVACTVFVGQLPYSATVKDIGEHFKHANGDVVPHVRLLTKRAADGGGSRGMAFVELDSEAAVHTALRLHHSPMGSRRINVERTVGGGGTTAKRHGHISDLRERQGKQMVQAVQAICRKLLPGKEDGEEEREEAQVGATREDIDERVLDFLCTIPTSVAEEALTECTTISFANVKNRSAYLMGLLKRKTAEADTSRHNWSGPSGEASSTTDGETHKRRTPRSKNSARHSPSGQSEKKKGGGKRGGVKKDDAKKGDKKEGVVKKDDAKKGDKKEGVVKKDDAKKGDKKKGVVKKDDAKKGDVKRKRTAETSPKKKKAKSA